MATLAQTLELAVKHHRAGDLRQAEQLYRQVLGLDPQNVNALHLLGVVALQFGRYDLAITWIGGALRLKPDFADAHNNLGNAFRGQNKLEEAVASYRQALLFNPHHCDAHNNLGNVLAMQGKLDEALPHLLQVIRLKPDFAEAHNSLGNALYYKGNLPGAVLSYGEAIRVNPGMADAHNNLGNVLLAQGKLVEAAASFEQALRLRPDFAEAHSNLGFVLCRLGRGAEALASCQKALRLKPGLAEAHANLATALIHEDKIEEAINHYRLALGINPNLAETHNNLGNALRKQGKLDEALASYREAVRLKPDHAETHSNLGSVLRVQGMLDQAVASCQEALRLKPDFADAHNNLGYALQRQGKLDEAVASYGEALRLQPGFADAYSNLSSALLAQGQIDQGLASVQEALRLAPGHAMAWHQLGRLARDGRYRFSVDELDQVRRLLAKPRGSFQEKSLLHFTLAYQSEQQGDYDLAFEHYRQGNACKRQAPELWSGFDIQVVRRQVDAAIATFQRELFERLAGHPSEVPVFIVGMPRSGTTLVEQILSSHPSFAGAGELPDIASIADNLHQKGDLHFRLTDPSVFSPGMTNGALLCHLAERYLQRLRRDSGEALRVSDKAPLNFLHLGLIAVLFPQARVIHCRRDPRDTCVSCFCENFDNLPFSTSLEDLGLYYREYARLMAHWRHVLPLALFELQYEDLVSRPESLSRQLLAFCGLDWDDRCMLFHQNRRPVQTASNLQVRQPIYARSVGRWQRYRTHLEGLLELLKPCLP